MTPNLGENVHDLMTTVKSEMPKLPESVKVVEYKRSGQLEMTITLSGEKREDIVNPLAGQFAIRHLRKDGYDTRGLVEMPIPYPHINPDQSSEMRADYRVVLNF